MRERVYDLMRTYSFHVFVCMCVSFIFPFTHIYFTIYARALSAHIQDHISRYICIASIQHTTPYTHILSMWYIYICIVSNKTSCMFPYMMIWFRIYIMHNVMRVYILPCKNKHDKLILPFELTRKRDIVPNKILFEQCLYISHMMYPSHLCDMIW